MSVDGYAYDAPSFAELLLRTYYPEKTTQESAIIRDYLVGHLREYDRVMFSARIGAGAPLDESTPESTQAQTAHVTRRRIDVVAWHLGQVTLIEAKLRVGHAVLGQLLSDRMLWLDERPSDPEPVLVAIGRESDDDSIRILNSHGISVFLYPAANAGR